MSYFFVSISPSPSSVPASKFEAVRVNSLGTVPISKLSILSAPGKSTSLLLFIFIVGARECREIATVALRMAYKRLACYMSGLFHLTREAFRCVLGEAEVKFYQSFANPGKICGALAA
jgi:hypothetical protein